jgi:hypothetical protein
MPLENGLTGPVTSNEVREIVAPEVASQRHSFWS